MRSWLALVVLCACGRVGFDDLPVVPDAPTAFSFPNSTALPLTKVRLTTDSAIAPTWIALDGGSIDANGVFSAPQATGTYHVQAQVGDVIEVANVNVTLTVFPSTIDSVGGLGDASGMSHQHHIAYVDGQYWVWYVTNSAVNELRVQHSPDGVVWTAGPTLTFASDVGTSGRNLDVAVRDLGGHHVVHLTVGFETGRGRYHVRAILDAGVLQYGVPQLVNQGGNVSPDGPSVVITPGGQVIDGTGYELTPQTPPLSPCGDGDVEMFTAAVLDDGTTSFDAMTWMRSVIWCVPVRVNARRLLADGETVYEIYDDGNQDPDPANLHYNIRTPTGTWLPDETTLTVPPFVFAGSSPTPQLNDWAAEILGRKLHVLRRIGAASNTFEHRTYDLDGGGGFVDAPIPATRVGVSGTGLVVMHYGEGLLAIMLNTGSSLDYSFLSDQTWSAWTTVDLPVGFRAALAGGEGGGRAMVIWTDSSSTDSLSAVALP